jgi:hypothetical protein
VEDKFEVILQPDAQDDMRTDVFIRNVATGEQSFFLNLEDVYRQQYHPAEYQNGHLYIILRKGDPFAQDAVWSDELWQYDSQGNGIQLYSAKGLDFRVAPAESIIAIQYDISGENPNEGISLVFVNTHGDVVHELQVEAPDQLVAYASSPNSWSDDGLTYWGSLDAGPTPHYFYVVNTASWQFSTYPVSQLHLGHDYALNPNTGRLVYSDYPVFFIVEALQEFQDSGKAVTLGLFDLNSQNVQIIATSAAKAFQPEWLDERTVEYNDPGSAERIVYILP